MKMRIIGAILVILVSVPLLLIGKMPFIIACGVLGAFSLKELMELKKHHQKIPNFMFILSIILLILFIFWEMDTYIFSLYLDKEFFIFTFLCLVFPTLFYKREKYQTSDAIYLFGCILFLVMFCKSLIFLRTDNVYILWYLIFIAIFTDTFAFLIGSVIGHHKCSPRISPNKTWEGSIAGTIVGALLATLFYAIKIGNKNILNIIMLSILLSIAGQLGDLFFSKVKRENDIKDFSHLIPGHGGILDRIDSLIFIVLAYMVLAGIM